jgi:endonuclease G
VTVVTGVGFDPDFLWVAAPLPTMTAAVDIRELTFTHFTVLVQPQRRLAVTTGVNIDGAQLLNLDRGDDWHLDPRIPTSEQVGPELYAKNDLDRGHLVRRRDPVWGAPAVAAQANLDSFAYVNAAPQAALFNQGELLWAGLEDYILKYARLYQQRLSVYTAPVLAGDDPVYRGVAVPRQFWKIAAWATHDSTDQDADSSDSPRLRLAATGYLLDQSQQLDAVLQADTRTVDTDQIPPLGQYLTYQVPVGDIAALTGLNFGPLIAADQLSTAEPVPAGTLRPGTEAVAARWIPLRTLHDIRLW